MTILNLKETIMCELAFEIGFDHYRFNLPLDIPRFYDNHRKQVRDGYEAAETLNVTRKKPDRYDQKLMGIRDRSLIKGLEVSITVNDLKLRLEETKGVCPITLVPFTFAENELTDWSVDRIDNSRGYCCDNIVIVSVMANQAKSNLDLIAIIKQVFHSEVAHSLLTVSQWLRMAFFYYPIMNITRPLSLCLILSDDQILYDFIVIALLNKNESKSARAILKNLNKYIATDAIYKAVKLTQKRSYLCSGNAENVLYRSPKLHCWVKSFIATINSHSAEFDPLFLKYLFSPSPYNPLLKQSVKSRSYDLLEITRS
jgi:hypothetical protein